ncbi:MAG: hypothetical protein JWP57_3901, partial [Spirosoma sp.]|nr:hypothetical protein [Spirosoma sp.]
MALIVAVLSITGFTTRTPDKETVLKTAREAYLYGLPLVLTDLTRIGGGRPDNVFTHSHAFPDHTFRLVVRPNNDTYYSSAFLDLGAEPIVLSIPDTKDRYAVVPLMDAWTNVFASFGKRTTGTKAQTYVVTGPTWKGKLPNGLPQVKSPTDLVWIIGRVQVNSPEDGKQVVVPIQKGLKLTPLSQWGKGEQAPLPTAVSPVYSVEKSEAVQALKAKKISVVEALNRLSTEEYFTYLNELLVKNPGTPADKPALDRFAQIGIQPGTKFDISTFDAATQTELNSVATKLLASFDAGRTILRDRKEGKPDLTMGHYGTNYQKRAAVAYFGLGALGPEDAVYLGYNTDETGQPLTGNASYIIHFEPKKTPPARAFWSITLYDKAGYLTENPIRRYAIGDRDKLKFNPDGSLDIYVQHASPGN